MQSPQVCPTEYRWTRSQRRPAPTFCRTSCSNDLFIRCTVCLPFQLRYMRTKYLQNHTWDTARRIIQMIHMIIIHVYPIIWCFTQLTGLILGAGRPAETWSGSSLWANRPYTILLAMLHAFSPRLEPWQTDLFQLAPMSLSVYLYWRSRHPLLRLKVVHSYIYFSVTLVISDSVFTSPKQKQNMKSCTPGVAPCRHRDSGPF